MSVCTGGREGRYCFEQLSHMEINEFTFQFLRLSIAASYSYFLLLCHWWSREQLCSEAESHYALAALLI